MGHILVTASKALVLANSNSRTATIKLTSVIASPFSEASVSAHVTLYAATAATDGTQFLFLRCGTSARTVVWQDPASGIELPGSIIYVATNCAFATLVWN